MPGSVYTTRAKLEAAGIPLTGVSADVVNDLIRASSATMDTLLSGLRFFPLVETAWLDGRDTALVERGNGLPILSVNDVTIERDRTSRGARPYVGWGAGLLGSIQQPAPLQASGALSLGAPAFLSTTLPIFDWPADAYVLRPEPLSLFIQAVRGVFPAGIANIRVSGVFGFADPSSIKTFSTTLAAPLAPNDVQVALTSVAGAEPLRPRDVLVIGEGSSSVAVISGAIDGALNHVAIDPLTGVISSAIPQGTQVKSWGAAPREIELACIHFCNRELARKRVRARGGSHEPSLVRRQWTDGFGWELFAPGGTTGSSVTADMITGVPEVDRILVEYLKSVWARAT